MKVILATFNAKYIHTSLALRWLYVAGRDRFDISFREYTVKDSVDRVASELTGSGCGVVGISLYIWNAAKSLQLAAALKERNPQLTVILGGPEVTYEPECFVDDPNVDYVVSGEGEFVLRELLESIERGGDRIIPGVSSKRHVSREVVRADVERLAALPSPYQLEGDAGDLRNRLVYFETSRGCPYGCAYCLSSLEKGVRYFPDDFVTMNLSYLIRNGVRQVKFLDRTFNIDMERMRRIFDFLLSNYRSGLSFQFEIYAELLTDGIIDYLNDNLPEKYFRFEIGVQSTFMPANEAVGRKQDFGRLASNVRKLINGGRADLHLDLIAGLPFETFERFAVSFNEVFGLGAKEVQLGFLKMLRGTALRREAGKYGYRYDSRAPYEVLSNDYISCMELDRVRDAEHALEKFWNSGRFAHTMRLLFTEYYAGRYFELFDEIGMFCRRSAYPRYGYQLEDLFRCLHEFLLTKGIDLLDSLKEDYYANFNIRPHGFWKDALSKESRKRLIYKIGQDKEFLRRNSLNRKIIEKQTAVDPLGDGKYLLTVFLCDDNGRYSRLKILYDMD